MGDHVLHLYSDDQERERVVADTFSWLPKGAKMLVFSPQGNLPSHLSNGNGLMRDSRLAVREGKLESLSSDDVYFPDGSFDSQATLRKLTDAAERAESEGFKFLVAVGDASRIVDLEESNPEYFRYETAVNFLDLPIDVAFICQYDRRIMPPDHQRRVVSVHEKLLRDRQLERNCWFISRRGV